MLSLESRIRSNLQPFSVVCAFSLPGWRWHLGCYGVSYYLETLESYSRKIVCAAKALFADYLGTEADRG
jgi:hypothetical protein